MAKTAMFKVLPLSLLYDFDCCTCILIQCTLILGNLIFLRISALLLEWEALLAFVLVADWEPG